MIGYIQGKILRKEDDRILLLANQVGYEILVPSVIMAALSHKQVGDDLALHIFYQQTERQPKPVLIGFNQDVEKEFFQNFVSVEDIGPLKAVKALTIPVGEIARAIEDRDLVALSGLKGIGKRTAQKIIATLEGRMGKFALMGGEPQPAAQAPDDLSRQVLDVMVHQLGHRPADARKMIADALTRNRAISTPEELFEEVYRGEQASLEKPPAGEVD